MCANVAVKMHKNQQNTTKTRVNKKTTVQSPPKWLVNNMVQSFCKRLNKHACWQTWPGGEKGLAL